MPTPINQTLLKQHILDSSKKPDFYLIEVTEGETYGRLHLPGAIQLGSFSDVEFWLDAEAPDRTFPVVCYGENSEDAWRAEQIARFLEAVGFQKVGVYFEGKEDWISSELPLETDFYLPENRSLFDQAGQGVAQGPEKKTIPRAS